MIRSELVWAVINVHKRSESMLNGSFGRTRKDAIARGREAFIGATTDPALRERWGRAFDDCLRRGDKRVQRVRIQWDPS